MKYTIWHGKAKPIVAIGVNQVKLLRFAEKFQGWHSFKNDRATMQAIAGLERKGCLEVDEINQMFKFKYPD